MSNTNKLRKNLETKGEYHGFVTGNNILSGNMQPYGSVTISQTQDGIMYSNVQAAIDDVAVMAQQFGVNTVVTNTDGVSPQGSPQIDSIKFSGMVLTDGKQTGDETLVDVFGFKVRAIVGDSAEDFTDKAIDRLKQALSQQIAFANVVKSSTASTSAEVTYRDYQTHNLQSYTDQGITITPSLVSPAKSGFGTWSLLGNTNIQLDGQKNPIKLYYFVRTS